MPPISTPHEPVTPSPDHHYLFVTGRLAENAVRGIVDQLSRNYGLTSSIAVMPITVAALMTGKWLKRKLQVPPQVTHVILPGHCEQDLSELQEHFQPAVLCGPKDCRELPEWFGGERLPVDLSDHTIEIIAEINHAPRWALAEFDRQAKVLVRDGADTIDIGCDPSSRCQAIGDYVARLVDQGIRCSIDTFDPWEAEHAVRRGASLVLSVNSSNRQAAADWGAEVVAIPDEPDDLDSLDETIDYLTSRNVPRRIDPILEPIGAGLMQSLSRYARTRERYPDATMMMGIGNLTELSDVDSAGINLLLLGICEELGVQSVLTTQVINWSRTSVRECEIARRIVHHAIRNRVPPKNVSDALVMLRDPKLRPFADEALASLADTLKDNNYRLFAQEGEIHLLSAGLHLRDDDPFQLFEQLLSRAVSDNIDVSHAFYLGFEMAKASIALTLGKQYEQDESLRWGTLTRQEEFHRLTRTSRHRRQ